VLAQRFAPRRSAQSGAARRVFEQLPHRSGKGGDIA
jgi:hypothetical protein